LAAEADCDLETIGILGAFNTPSISSVVVGFMSPDQVDHAVAAAQTTVDEAIIVEAVRIRTDLPDDIRDPL
jgi:aryl-alcohol dehydrogenase-like predicted oxidoreductase